MFKGPVLLYFVTLQAADQSIIVDTLHSTRTILNRRNIDLIYLFVDSNTGSLTTSHRCILDSTRRAMGCQSSLISRKISYTSLPPSSVDLKFYSTYVISEIQKILTSFFLAFAASEINTIQIIINEDH